MNIMTAFPSAHLKADEMNGDETYTIKSVAIKTVGQGKDSEEKPVVEFNETDKTLVLNKTNSGVIAQLHGPETDNWTGKRITLYPTEVEYQGKVQLGIRVRLRAPSGGPAAPAHGGNGGAAPTDSVLAAAKAAAWAQFKAPLLAGGNPIESVQRDFAEAVKNYLPMKPREMWSAADWTQFAADEFLRRVADPRSPEQVFQEQDIPF